ncbi:MAG TPA: DUF47 family protein [Longimicrobiaceae bacterium]|nr:DUF47 family protein [Longimicrobiaceae bacterium]
MALFPRDEKFFDLFDGLAKRLAESAQILDRLFSDPQHLVEHVTAIKQLEHQADQLTRSVVGRIDRSFITPIDREDIHLLTTHLDDVIDLVDGTARRALLFRISEVRQPARRLCAILVKATATIETAVANMKKPTDVAMHARALKELEEQGDSVYQEAIGGLFEGTPDPLEVIKWKELYDKLEDTLDQCEDVGNVLESISIKNS